MNADAHALPAGAAPPGRSERSPHEAATRGERVLDGEGWGSAAALALEHTWRDRPGLLGWLRTNDHKRIGLRFVVTAFVFFVAAGLLAAVMRAQLAFPDNPLVGPDLYNQLFTMHGTTMMFIFAVPVMQGMAVYLVPLMAGTRNTAFPRMTACAY